VAVNTLLADDDLRAAMSARARQRVEEHFSWSSIARRTLDFYEALIERSRITRTGPYREIRG
jgi:glycosyltransferase involved in cell wall biosynthesis